MPTKANMVSIR